MCSSRWARPSRRLPRPGERLPGRRPVRRDHGDPADALRVTCSGPDAAQVPLDVTNLAARAALALAGRHGLEPAVHIHIAKDIPSPAAWQVAARTGPARSWPATRCGARGRHARNCSRSAPSWAAMCRSAWWAGAAGHRAGREAHGARGRRDLPLGVRHGRWGAVDARGVPRVRPARRRSTDPRTRRLTGSAGGAGQGGHRGARGGGVQRPRAGRAVPFPELAQTLAAGRAAGALTALVSGSGPTTAFLARDASGAERIAEALRASGTCKSARVAPSPAPGATVVHPGHRDATGARD